MRNLIYLHLITLSLSNTFTIEFRRGHYTALGPHPARKGHFLKAFFNPARETIIKTAVWTKIAAHH
jgi:hypothetical protein